MVEGNKAVRRGLSLPEYSTQDRNTIYKLRLSMKRRFSPQEGASTSLIEAGETRDLLQRLMEIYNESRVLLSKVFLLLEKDENLEEYVKKKIEDPKVSKMWQLVEQVLAFQEGDELNVKEMIMNDDDEDNLSNYITNEKAGKEKEEPVETEKKNERFKIKSIGSGTDGKKNERFKVRSIGSGTGVQAGSTSSGSSAGAASTKIAGSSSSTNNTGHAK